MGKKGKGGKRANAAHKASDELIDLKAIRQCQAHIRRVQENELAARMVQACVRRETWAIVQTYGLLHPDEYGGVRTVGGVLTAYLTADLEAHRSRLAAALGPDVSFDVRPCRYSRTQAQTWQDAVDTWVAEDEERLRQLDIHWEPCGLDWTPDGLVPTVVMGHPWSPWRAAEIRRQLAPIPVRVCWSNQDRHALGPASRAAFEAERDRLRPAFARATAYAEQHPDTFGAVRWDDDGAPVPLVVAEFTADLDTHQDALGAEVVVRPCAYSRRQVERWLAEIEAWVRASPARRKDLGIVRWEVVRTPEGIAPGIKLSDARRFSEVTGEIAAELGPIPLDIWPEHIFTTPVLIIHPPPDERSPQVERPGRTVT